MKLKVHVGMISVILFCALGVAWGVYQLSHNAKPTMVYLICGVAQFVCMIVNIRTYANWPRKVSP